ncbi:MAG TPA: sugar ABC transporter ATP-binding protein, partial [Bacillota bacterium]|nr:sugar ABC transporter ATP-binding protein [Bacillota bacterium]
MTQHSFMVAQGISKEFPGVRALTDVSFECKLGSVHALIGENGAGKSTLIKILSGVYHPTRGEILINNQSVKLNHPDQAARLGVSVIHQELNLIPVLTVAENIFLGHEPILPSGAIDRKLMREKSKALLTKVGIDVDPDMLVKKLPLAQKQMVEIAKALSREESKIIIMDEPTAALNHNEVEKLMELIHNLIASNMGVVFISHRLEEIFQIADTVTVLRDGQLVGTQPTSDLTMDMLIQMMTGKSIIGTRVEGTKPVQTEKVLEVRNLSAKRWFHDINLTVHAGEIVGLIGLEGQGQREFLRSIFGIVKTISGEILIDDQPVKIRSISDALAAGLAFVPEERKVEGLCLVLDILQNMALPTLKKRQKFGFINLIEERKLANELINTLKVQPPNPSHLTNNLSGGNQQKVVIAKWLPAKPKVFVFAEPTRGVDIGAKEEIYLLLRKLTDQGVGIL